MIKFEHDLVRMNHVMEIDPIGRRLPVGKLDFAVGNADYRYNPDNPRGPWKDMEEHNPVTVRYGQVLTGGLKWDDVRASGWADVELTSWRALMEGGLMEMVPAGRYYLNARPVADGMVASFECVDVLSLARGAYYKGRLGGGNLYDLALAVLKDAGLPLLPDGSEPWLLWEGLRGISTSAPVPLLTHREALQLIAHAACCVLFCDREGRVCIRPLDTGMLDRHIDFEAQVGEPKVAKIEPVGRVDCRVYHYAGAEEPRELLRQAYVVNGELPVHVELPRGAADVQVFAEGGAASATVFAYAADVVLRGNGEVVLVVTGRALEKNYTLAAALVAEPPEKAAFEEVDNPLVTDLAQGQKVAAWVRNWLLNRVTYQTETRGYPEIDPGDHLWLQSRFTEKLPACVLESRLEYDGSLRGSMTAKRIEG